MAGLSSANGSMGSAVPPSMASSLKMRPNKAANLQNQE
jgi:hypothetical protein